MIQTSRDFKKLRKSTSAKIAFLGWGAICAFVVSYDSWALATEHETLSSAFWRTKRNPLGRLLLVAGWGGLSWHLLFGDKQILIDPLHEAYVSMHPLYRGRDFIVKRQVAAD